MVKQTSSSGSSISFLLLLSFVISLLFFSLVSSIPKAKAASLAEDSDTFSLTTLKDKLALTRKATRRKLEIEDIILPEDCAGKTIYDNDFYDYLVHKMEEKNNIEGGKSSLDGISKFFDDKNIYRVQNFTDHVLVSLTVKDNALDEILFTSNPFKPLHFRLGEDHLVDIVNLGILGMCEGGTRSITSPSNQGYGYGGEKSSPYFPSLATNNVDDTHPLQFIVTLHNVTMEEDYTIFKHMDDRNVSAVLDMIEKGVGVNAIDEFGSSTLMRATIERNELVVAALMNCRRPNVWINACKPTGYTALIYSVSQRTPALLKAFLRRGADPNLRVLEGGSQGYTALHFAIKLEHYDHASILLSYGADPTITTGDGVSALDLVHSVEMIKKQKDRWLNLINDAIYLWNKKEMEAIARELEQEQIEDELIEVPLSVKDQVEQEMKKKDEMNILQQPKKVMFGEL